MKNEPIEEEDESRSEKSDLEKKNSDLISVKAEHVKKELESGKS